MGKLILTGKRGYNFGSIKVKVNKIVYKMKPNEEVEIDLPNGIYLIEVSQMGVSSSQKIKIKDTPQSYIVQLRVSFWFYFVLLLLWIFAFFFMDSANIYRGLLSIMTGVVILGSGIYSAVRGYFVFKEV